MEAWTRLWQAATNGFSTDASYYRVQGLNPDGTPNPAFETLLDVPNLIDYMLVIIFGGDLDAPISNFLGNSSPCQRVGHVQLGFPKTHLPDDGVEFRVYVFIGFMVDVEQTFKGNTFFFYHFPYNRGCFRVSRPDTHLAFQKRPRVVDHE